MQTCESISSDTNQSNAGIVMPLTVEKEVDIKKRKSFAGRRSLCFNNIGVNYLKNEGTQDASTLVKNEAQMKEYMEKLEIEREGWKKLYETRKKQYKKLYRKVNSEPLLLNRDSCADCLSEKDKQFLKNKPDYDGTVLKLQQFEEVAAIYSHVQHKTAHINNSLLTVFEQKIAMKRDKIYKYLNSYY